MLAFVELSTMHLTCFRSVNNTEINYNHFTTLHLDMLLPLHLSVMVSVEFARDGVNFTATMISRHCRYMFTGAWCTGIP